MCTSAAHDVAVALKPQKKFGLSLVRCTFSWSTVLKLFIACAEVWCCGGALTLDFGTRSVLCCGCGGDETIIFRSGIGVCLNGYEEPRRWEDVNGIDEEPLSRAVYAACVYPEKTLGGSCGMKSQSALISSSESSTLRESSKARLFLLA